MSGLAPIVLFAFSRPDHTRRTLAALAGNSFADQSDLIVYADAARSEGDVENVRAVRDLIRGADGFKSLTVIERKTNYGLARNIIEGVTEVCEQYGRVIVLEDDIVTSPYFLDFMNRGLSRYADETRVWHISGWNYPIDESGLGGAFLWRAMNCWGWGTWWDRWARYKKDPSALIGSWAAEKVKRFNLGGRHNFWDQVKANQSGKIDTWAIFWYATIFDNEGLCLNPSRTLVRNIGVDGTGENCGSADVFTECLGTVPAGDLPDVISESKTALYRIQEFYRALKPSVARRIINKAKRMFT